MPASWMTRSCDLKVFRVGFVYSSLASFLSIPTTSSHQSHLSWSLFKLRHCSDVSALFMFHLQAYKESHFSFDCFPISSSKQSRTSAPTITTGAKPTGLKNPALNRDNCFHRSCGTASWNVCSARFLWVTSFSRAMELVNVIEIKGVNVGKIALVFASKDAELVPISHT